MYSAESSFVAFRGDLELISWGSGNDRLRSTLPKKIAGLDVRGDEEK